jgi:hypothetical protein
MRNPWYVIAWRTLWIGPVFLGLMAALAFVCIGWGPREAKSMWRGGLRWR